MVSDPGTFEGGSTIFKTKEIKFNIIYEEDMETPHPCFHVKPSSPTELPGFQTKGARPDLIEIMRYWSLRLKM